ncbi:MAG TPA: long-chain fatty acid--CoA ligase [Thermoplasmata archaeon]|nr:long-chain fatty acid--CoA ligase [Thermoplasmata archaeon]
MSSPTPPENGRPWLRSYPAHVPHQLEVPEVTLPEMLRRSAAQWPARPALLYYGRRWSYAELWELSGRVAANLQADGLGPGDRVALYLPNCPAYPISFFGALRAGLTVVQVSPLYLGQDLSRELNDAQPRAIVTLEILYPNLAAVDADVEVPLRYVARLRNFYPFPTRLLVNFALRRRGHPTAFPTDPRVRDWVRLLRPGTPEPVAIDPNTAIAVFQYTGGTTGEPRAAMLSHRNLVANALQCRAWFAVQPSGTGTVLASIPLFHIYGLTVAMTYPICAGETIVLETRPDAGEILRLVAKYRPTEFPGVPALYQAINAHPRTPRYDLRSIQVCVSGSAPLPVEVAKRFIESTGANLIEGYGLTEASPVTHANPIRGEVRLGSIGLPLPATDQRIVDLETGARVLPIGEVGELCVRGPQVMVGYYRREDETAATVRDGWLHTGDIGRLDADGYAYVIDRKKDTIIVGGFKLYPREVEEVLYQHPAVAEAAVVGVGDPSLSEVVHAVVVRKPGSTVTEAELIEFVRARMAHYKAPRRVHFRPSLPRTSIQKVLRRVLRTELEAAERGGPGAPVAAARAT